MSEIQFLRMKKDGNWLSSHLSIFPHKTISFRMRESAINNGYMILANDNAAFKVPGNIAHYMRPELDLNIRFNPPNDLKQMLLGNFPIYLRPDLHEVHIQEIGWVDFAHYESDGSAVVYSGMYNGILSYVNKWNVPLEYGNALIECYDKNHVRLAGTCARMSTSELNEMNIIHSRMMWLTQIAELRANFSDEEINKMLATSDVTMKEIFGEWNYLCSLSSNAIQFIRVDSNKMKGLEGDNKGGEK